MTNDKDSTSPTHYAVISFTN